MALLTLIQQNSIKRISQNWANETFVGGGVTNFEQLLDEIENSDLRDLLGAALLLDIQDNPADVKYIDLLDGKKFTDCEGNFIQFKGIRYQLAYMLYSEYIMVSGIKDTFIGMVRKTRDESTDVSSADKRNEQNRIRKIAMSDFEIMKIYLDDNIDTYTLWNCTTSKKIYTPKLTIIRKTVK